MQWMMYRVSGPGGNLSPPMAHFPDQRCMWSGLRVRRQQPTQRRGQQVSRKDSKRIRRVTFFLHSEKNLTYPLTS